MKERVEIPINVTLTETGTNVSFTDDGPFDASFGAMSKVETGDYDKLGNKPKINAVTVQGDKLGADYNLQDKMNAITPQMIDDLFYGRY